jgi:anti-repressor protein
MKVEKFIKSEFGSLTTITSDKTGVVMFVAKEVAEFWGHTNLKQSVNRICNKNDYKVIKLKQFPEFKKILLSNNLLLSSNASSIMLLTESGLYKLALASNLDKAKPFRDWVTSEVLPSIRKNGYYSLADQTDKIMIHTNVSVQKQNSKDVNAKHLIERGVEGVIDYNRQNCIIHTGKTPSEIKKIGKSKGLKSTETSSAKQVLRRLDPAVACGMSFTDSLVKQGFDLNTVSELSKNSAIPLFQGMIELGIRPAELGE